MRFGIPRYSICMITPLVLVPAFPFGTQAQEPFRDCHPPSARHGSLIRGAVRLRPGLQAVWLYPSVLSSARSIAGGHWCKDPSDGRPTLWQLPKNNTTDTALPSHVPAGASCDTIPLLPNVSVLRAIGPHDNQLIPSSHHQLNNSPGLHSIGSAPIEQLGRCDAR